MEKKSLQSYKVQCRTKTELKTTNQIPKSSLGSDCTERNVTVQKCAHFWFFKNVTKRPVARNRNVTAKTAVIFKYFCVNCCNFLSLTSGAFTISKVHRFWMRRRKMRAFCVCFSKTVQFLKKS